MLIQATFGDCELVLVVLVAHLSATERVVADVGLGDGPSLPFPLVLSGEWGVEVSRIAEVQK